MRQRMRLVILGDSVTAGFGLRPQAPLECGSGVAFPQLLATRLNEAGHPVDVVPSALEGIDTGYAVRRFSRLVTTHDPDWVMVMLGLNDVRPPGARSSATPAEYRQNLLALVDRIMALEAKPFLVAPNPRFERRSLPTFPPANGHASGGRQFFEPVVETVVELMRPYVDILQGVADACHIPWVDLHRQMMTAERLNLLIPDGIHPSALGHEFIADVLAEELLSMLPHYEEASALLRKDANDTAPAEVLQSQVASL